jgi:MFS family permease
LSGYKIYSGTVLVLGIVQFIESIAFSIPQSYFPNYVVGLGATVASIGLFTSSFMLAEMILSPRMGSLSDVHGRRKIMIVGLIGDIIIGALTGLAPNWYWLLLIRVVNGAATSAAMLAAEALLMDCVSQHRRGEASGFVMSMGMVGRNIGPLFGGFIQSVSVSSGLSLLDSYRVPYFADDGLAGLALLLVVWKVHDLRTDQSQEKPRTIENAGPPMRAKRLTMSSSFKALLVCSFINGMGAGFIIPIMALFYNDKFGIEPVEIGLILTISSFVGFLSSWASGRLSDKVGRKPLIATGSFLQSICGYFLPLTGDVIQATAVLSGRSLGFDINMPAMRALRADITPTEARGRYFGMFRTAWTAGDIIGPIMGTYLYDLFRFKQFQLAGITLPGYG